MAVQGSPLPFAGSPYAENQLMAQNAYEQALAQLQTQRNQYMTNEGFNSQNGSLLYSPTSAWGQLSNSIQGQENASQANLLSRGLLSGGMPAAGLGAQQQEQVDYGRDVALNNFGQAYLAGMGKIDQKILNTKQNFNSQTTRNRLALVQYLINHGQFTHGK